MNEDWRKDALCVGKNVHLFYPEVNVKGAIKQINAMKAICNMCPVKFECLEFAIENNEEYGIWGGMLANERKRIRRYRKRVNAETSVQPQQKENQ